VDLDGGANIPTRAFGRINASGGATREFRPTGLTLGLSRFLNKLIGAGPITWDRDDITSASTHMAALEAGGYPVEWEQRYIKWPW
jgi:hypothetical protein